MIAIRVVGECEDSALLKAFGEQGLGLFAMPSLIAPEVQQKYGVAVLGRIESIRKRFYALHSAPFSGVLKQF